MDRYMDPGDFNQQYRPGMRIWVSLPNGTFSGTLIRTFGNSAEIQLDSGSMITVDVNQNSVAGTGAPPMQQGQGWPGSSLPFRHGGQDRP